MSLALPWQIYSCPFLSCTFNSLGFYFLCAVVVSVASLWRVERLCRVQNAFYISGDSSLGLIDLFSPLSSPAGPHAALYFPLSFVYISFSSLTSPSPLPINSLAHRSIDPASLSKGKAAGFGEGGGGGVDLDELEEGLTLDAIVGITVGVRCLLCSLSCRRCGRGGREGGNAGSRQAFVRSC